MGNKICFFDIDGTLTSELPNELGVVPLSTKLALKQAKDNGVIIFINTGRPFGTLPKEVLELDVDGYCCGCGTYVVMNDEVLFHRLVKDEERSNIINSILEANIGACLEGRLGYSLIDGNVDRSKIVDLNYTASGFSCFDYEDFEFEKFCIYINQNDKWPNLDFLSEFDLITGNDNFMEVVPKSCSKWKAIEFLLDYLDISIDDCYVFGDSDNDLSMFKEAKNKIAMGNASKSILNLASFVTKNSSDDGIEHALKHFNLI